jgi:hypothetical protein
LEHEADSEERPATMQPVFQCRKAVIQQISKLNYRVLKVYMLQIREKPEKSKATVALGYRWKTVLY